MKKQNRNNGLSFRYIFKKDNKQNLMLAILLSISTFLAFKSMFEFGWNELLFLLADIVFCLLYFKEKTHKYFKYGSVAIIIILIIIIALKGKYICSSIYFINNQIAGILGRKAGIYLTQYQIPLVGTGMEVAKGFSLFIIAYVISLWCCVWIYRRLNIFAYIPAGMILYSYLFTKIRGNYVYGFILALILMAGVYTDGIKRGCGKKIHGNLTKVMCQYIVSVLLIGALLGGVMQVLIPEISYHPIPFLDNLNNSLDEYISCLRYNKGKKLSYTLGDFTRLGNFTPRDGESLEVIMENPDAMYLRGFVGSTYNHTGWSEADNEDLYDDYSSIFWLHKEGFDGLNQLSEAAELTEKVDKEFKNSTMIIHNISGNSKYLYLPYELSRDSKNDFINDDMWDISTKSKGVAGDRYYKISIDKGITKEYPSIALEYYKILGEGSDKQYINDEKIYNNFVYKNFLSVSDDIKQLLYAHLGPVPNTDEKHIPYEDAYKIITDYLKKNVVYDEEPGILPDKTDFLQYFLETNGRGYAAHYATAAVMMYRYLGIPARYVEGYIITPKQASDAESMSPIVLTEKNAHAWAEIYQDGIGWVPVEVTPPYESIMGAPDYFAVSNENVAILDKSENEYDEDSIHNPEELNKQYTKEKAVSVLVFIIKLVVILLVVLLMFIMLYIILRNHIICRRRKKEFISSDYRHAIKELYKYMGSLIKYDKSLNIEGSVYSIIPSMNNVYGPQYTEKFIGILSVFQEAAYSNHVMSYEQYKAAYSFVKNTLDNMLKKKNLFQRLYMKYWKVLY